MWTEVSLEILSMPLELPPEQLGASPGREGERVGVDMKKHVLDIHPWAQRTSGIKIASNEGWIDKTVRRLGVLQTLVLRLVLLGKPISGLRRKSSDATSSCAAKDDATSCTSFCST